MFQSWSNLTLDLTEQVLTRDTKENEPYDPNVRRADYGSAYLYISPAYSKSNSFLKLKQISQGFACDRDATVTAQYIIQGKEWKKNQPVLNFFYLVCVTFIAPFVSLKFSSVQQLPAEKTTLTVKANPKSLCSVRAIDQSVLLLKPEQELNVDYVFNQLPVQKLWGYDYEVEDFDPFSCFPRPLPRPIPVLEPEVGLRSKRSRFFPPFYHQLDVYSIFKDIGVKIVTNSDVKKPNDCFLYKLD
ncbi:hypothetical protein XENOCAPTIV_005318, partial [Xenoophorus captivus]